MGVNNDATEAVVGRCFVKKVFLKLSQNSQEKNYARVSFLIKLLACNFIKKDTLVQVFSYEFCVIFKHTFLTKHLWEAASNLKPTSSPEQ